jgi:hypothetical protein
MTTVIMLTSVDTGQVATLSVGEGIDTDEVSSDLLRAMDKGISFAFKGNKINLIIPRDILLSSIFQVVETENLFPEEDE